MKKLYEPCPYCNSVILKKPYLERQQGDYSILCPYCLTHRSEWVESIEKAIISWNTYMRESARGVLYYAEILSELCEKMALEYLEHIEWEPERPPKIPQRKYRLKSRYEQIPLPFMDTVKTNRRLCLRRGPVSLPEQGYEIPEENYFAKKARRRGQDGHSFR